MRGLNKVMIMGNLGFDPEVRYTTSGAAVTNLRVATSEVWKDRQTGEKQERTEWHRIVLFARLGEIAAQYLRKGSRVFIEGTIRTNKWQDQSGNDRYTTEIIANNLQLMDTKGGGAAGGTMADDVDMMPTETQAAQSGKSTKSTQKVPATTLDEAFDDDIPF